MWSRIWAEGERWKTSLIHCVNFHKLKWYHNQTLRLTFSYLEYEEESVRNLSNVSKFIPVRSTWNSCFLMFYWIFHHKAMIRLQRSMPFTQVAYVVPIISKGLREWILGLEKISSSTARNHTFLLTKSSASHHEWKFEGLQWVWMRGDEWGWWQTGGNSEWGVSNPRLVSEPPLRLKEWLTVGDGDNRWFRLPSCHYSISPYVRDWEAIVEVGHASGAW